MKLPRRQFLRLAACATALPPFSRSAEAQAYPTRPITIIVPIAAGGPLDAEGRIVAEQMRGSLGRPIIIENISGKKYWDFMGERIFRPLEMTATQDRRPGDIISNRAAGYEHTNHIWINRDYDLTDVFAAGAIVSNIGDLTKWNAALDCDAILNAASKEQMWTLTKLNNGKATKYGFGLQNPRLPATTFGRHSSNERYWHCQWSPSLVTAHQGASLAFVGCRPKSTARATTAAKITRTIFDLRASRWQ